MRDKRLFGILTLLSCAFLFIQCDDDSYYNDDIKIPDKINNFIDTYCTERFANSIFTEMGSDAKIDYIAFFNEDDNQYSYSNSLTVKFDEDGAWFYAQKDGYSNVLNRLYGSLPEAIKNEKEKLVLNDTITGIMKYRDDLYEINSGYPDVKTVIISWDEDIKRWQGEKCDHTIIDFLCEHMPDLDIAHAKSRLVYNLLCVDPVLYQWKTFTKKSYNITDCKIEIDTDVNRDWSSIRFIGKYIPVSIIETLPPDIKKTLEEIEIINVVTLINKSTDGGYVIHADNLIVPETIVVVFDENGNPEEIQ